MRYVVFLQNAWSPFYAGGEWPRDLWLKALSRCRSGQRLRLMIGEHLDRCWNTTPIVGETVDSIVPPDRDYIRAVLETEAPDFVIACGVQAVGVLAEVWSGPLLGVPHPAARLMKDRLYRQVAEMIVAGVKGRVQFKATAAGQSIEPISRSEACPTLPL